MRTSLNAVVGYFTFAMTINFTNAFTLDNPLNDLK